MKVKKTTGSSIAGVVNMPLIIMGILNVYQKANLKAQDPMTKTTLACSRGQGFIHPTLIMNAGE